MPKKTYVTPQVTKVKLDASQAVLGQCSVGVILIRRNIPDLCNNTTDPCKKQRLQDGGDSAAHS